MIKDFKAFQEASVFTPDNLLREARRQKGIGTCQVPLVCVLDPDGDLVAYLIKTNQASVNACWACYHTTLYTVKQGDSEFGIIGCGVGASFAVLLAEQLFVSGCETLLSITSAGIINPTKNNSKFVLIREALRDEGTSYHYLPPSQPSTLNPELAERLLRYYITMPLSLETGLSWTTDAPYRETQTAIASTGRPRLFVWKWKRRPCMLLPRPKTSVSFVLRTSPTRWLSPKVTLKRAKKWVAWIFSNSFNIP